MKLTNFTFGLVSLITFVLANPISIESRDVFVPPITYPHAQTVWKVKQHHNVTWDTSNHPVNITNRVGRIMLNKGGIASPLILQEGFDILLGRIEVQVPWVIDGSDYQLVLFGDSGNFSPKFIITA